MRQDHEWVVGEKVAVLWSNKLTRSSTVARLTKTQVILSNGQKFRKDGTGLSDVYQREHIEPFNDSHQAVFKKHYLLKKIKEVKLDDLSLETLTKVSEALKNLGLIA
jgi:hypothetical protein